MGILPVSSISVSRGSGNSSALSSKASSLFSVIGN